MVSNLLVLPQEDLNSKQKGNLILLKLPFPIDQLQTCRMKMLSTSHSSALICNDTTTYALSALGTSNALVLVPPVVTPVVPVPLEQDGNPTESPRKKSKPSPDAPAADEARHIIRPSRLVQPGGSGAFFLEATLASVDATLVQTMLQEAPQTLAQLSSKLQFAPCQIQDVLDRMFVVCRKDTDQKYQVLDEETVLDAKRAILRVLVEEGSDHADTGVLRQSKQCVQHMATRLDPLPHATGIAQQLLEHLRLAPTEPNANDVMHLDANKVRNTHQQTNR